MFEWIRNALAWLYANQEVVWPILVGLIAIIATGAILWAWGESRNAKRLQAEHNRMYEDNRRQFKRMQSRMKNANSRIFNAVANEFASNLKPTMVSNSQRDLENGMSVSCHLNSPVSVVSVTAPSGIENQSGIVIRAVVDIRHNAPMIEVYYGPERSEYGKLDEQKLPKLIGRIVDHIHAHQKQHEAC